MCDVCDKARKQPTKAALFTVAAGMNRYPNRTCLDKLVGELVGASETGQDALDQETVQLAEEP